MIRRTFKLPLDIFRKIDTIILFLQDPVHAGFERCVGRIRRQAKRLRLIRPFDWVCLFSGKLIY